MGRGLARQMHREHVGNAMLESSDRLPGYQLQPEDVGRTVSVGARLRAM